MDEIKKYLAYEGRVNVICIEATKVVQDAMDKHKLTPLASKVLGKILMMGLIMGTGIKEDGESITIQMKGNGPIGTTVVVVDGKPHVKGYVVNPNVQFSFDKENNLDETELAIGTEGSLYVIKDLGLKEPYIGITPIITGGLEKNFEKYFDESEQTQSIVRLDVLIEGNKVKKAGGYFITFMPDATQEDVKQINETVRNAKSITNILKENISLQEMAETVTGDENLMVLLKQINPMYECDCCKEKFEGALKSLRKEEIKEIFEEQSVIETVCQFCNKKYNFTKEEIDLD